MNLRAINVAEGETVELQANLGATDVEILNSDTVAVLHDTTTEQTTYRRRFKRSHGPQNTTLEVPDSAVVVDFDGSAVHYFEEV